MTSLKNVSNFRQSTKLVLILSHQLLEHFAAQLTGLADCMDSTIRKCENIFIMQVVKKSPI